MISKEKATLFGQVVRADGRLEEITLLDKTEKGGRRKDKWIVRVRKTLKYPWVNYKFITRESELVHIYPYFCQGLG